MKIVVAYVLITTCILCCVLCIFNTFKVKSLKSNCRRRAVSDLHTTQLFTGMDNYRLGDIIRGTSIDEPFTAHGLGVWSYQRPTVFKGSLKEYTLQTFPDSIASQY